MQPLTLIVPFEVSEDQKDTFRKQWHEIAERLRHAPGLLSARLYEISSEVENYIRSNIPNMKWLEQRFRFVTIAEWVSVAHYEAAIRSSLEQKAITFPSYPTCYRLSDGIGSSSPTRARNGQEFTFIIPFEVPAGQEEEMRKQFKAVVEGMGKVEGALGPGLYEIDIEGEVHLQSVLSNRFGEEHDTRLMFRFVNVAEWESVSHYEAAMCSRRQIRPISFSGHGAYYRVVAEYTGQTV